MLKILIKYFILSTCIIIFNTTAIFSAEKNIPDSSIYNLNVNFIDHDNNILNINDLSKKVQIFAMIYTRCKTVCPIIIENMKNIEKLIPHKIKNDVNFVLVSLDPDRDTIDDLNFFFKNKKLNKNWKLLKASKEDTLKIAITTGIKYKKEKDGEYTHSNLIILLDKNGTINSKHQGLDKNYDSFVKKIINMH